LAFDMAKAQGAVVGSEIVSFVQGVTAQRRDAIVHSSLLAQLVAQKKIPDQTRIDDWYKEYFNVLSNVGWVIQDYAFAKYHESGKNFQAHEAILAVATTLLGAAPTALAIVTTTLSSLKSMDKNSPWMTIFDSQSQQARTARFQVGLAERARRQVHDHPGAVLQGESERRDPAPLLRARHDRLDSAGRGHGRHQGETHDARTRLRAPAA
jgi:hypothetical protein